MRRTVETSLCVTPRAVLLHSSKGDADLKATDVLVYHVWPLVTIVLLTLMFTLSFIPDSVYRLEVIHSLILLKPRVTCASGKSSWVFVTIYPSGISPRLLCQEALCLQRDRV